MKRLLSTIHDHRDALVCFVCVAVLLIFYMMERS